MDGGGRRYRLWLGVLLLIWVSSSTACEEPRRSPADLALALAGSDVRLRTALSPDRAQLTPRNGGFQANSAGGGLALALPGKADGALTLSRGAEFLRMRLESSKATEGTLDRRRLVFRDRADRPDFVLAPTCDEGPEGGCLVNGLEWAILLHRPGSPASFSWKLERSTGVARTRVESNGDVLLTDAKGLARFRILRPYALDSSGRRREATLELAQDRMTIRLDTEGLSFPVLLDPTIETAAWEELPAGLLHAAGVGLFDSNRQRVIVVGRALRHSFLLESAIWGWDGAEWQANEPADSPADYPQNGIVWDSARHRAVLFGGGVLGPALGDTWESDGTTWTRIQVTAQPPPRKGHAMAFDSVRGRTVLFGGTDIDGIPRQDTWEWDGVSWRFLSPASAPPARSEHLMAFDPVRNRVVLVGGFVWNGSGYPYRRETWEWDGTDWSRAATTCPPEMGMLRGSLTFDPSRGELVLYGGYDEAGNGEASPDLFAWDGSAWRLVPTTGRPPPRVDAAAVFDPSRGKLVVAGGRPASSSGWLDDTWELTGTVWRQVPLRPARRYAHVSAYDPLNRGVLMFGGLGLGPDAQGRTPALGDTWLWNGSSWRQLSPAHAPSPRAGAVLATDFRRQRLVLFGGAAVFSEAPLGDTWEWDGTDWVQVFPASSPPPRINAALAWDAARQRVVFFGGDFRADTWLWDGLNWKAAQPLQSPPNVGTAPSMAFSPVDQEIVMYRRDDSGSTWTWDGTEWKKNSVTPHPQQFSSRSSMASTSVGALWNGDWTWEWRQGEWFVRMGVMPPVRDMASMTEDPVRRRVVLFGGASTSIGARADLWEYHLRGAACSSAADCDTGWCVDGVCCESECGGGAFDCQACSRRAGSNVDGVCGSLCPSAGSCFEPTACDQGTGLCVAPVPKRDGTACDDGNECSSGDACLSGVCAGLATRPDGSPCGALLNCGRGSRCRNGACERGSAAESDRDPCDDGNSCTQMDRCAGGSCAGVPIGEGSSCDDGLACTASDTCVANRCVGVTECPPQTCAMTGVCSTQERRCVYVQAPDGAACDDQNACSQTDVCGSGRCVSSGPLRCPTVDECHIVRLSDPDGGFSSPVIPLSGVSCDGGACFDGRCEPLRLDAGSDWTARPPVSTGGGGGGGGGGTGGGGQEPPGGCGCTSSGAGKGWWALLLLAALAWRRARLSTAH